MKLWKLLDGKKTYLGLITTGIGVGGMIYGQEWASDAQSMTDGILAKLESHWAQIVTVIGLAKTLLGAIHKDVKLKGG